jgi:hypothetical protein
MKTNYTKTNSLVLIAVLLASIDINRSTCLAQGTLTPPGAPAPTMKSLDQIEPRTPISSAPFTITQPGSYYLTTNLIGGNFDVITIATNGVTLDLNGFTILSTFGPTTGTGILLNGGLRNITLANGFIQSGITNNGSGTYSGVGLFNGISYSGTPPVNVLVSRISVSSCLLYGIYLSNGDSTVVDSCTVRTVAGYGIFASTIKQSSAIDCGGTAIYGDQVSDCRGQSSGGDGVFAYTAENCHGQSSSGDGVHANAALNCRGESSSSFGVTADSAQNCYGYSTTGSGVNTATAESCIGACNGNGYGVYATAAQNCHGSSGGNGIGVFAFSTASGCYGFSNSGTGLSAFIANVCQGATTSGTTLSATHNVNSF